VPVKEKKILGLIVLIKSFLSRDKDSKAQHTARVERCSFDQAYLLMYTTLVCIALR